MDEESEESVTTSTNEEDPVSHPGSKGAETPTNEEKRSASAHAEDVSTVESTAKDPQDEIAEHESLVPQSLDNTLAPEKLRPLPRFKKRTEHIIDPVAIQLVDELAEATDSKDVLSIRRELLAMFQVAQRNSEKAAQKRVRHRPPIPLFPKDALLVVAETCRRHGLLEESQETLTEYLETNPEGGLYARALLLRMQLDPEKDTSIKSVLESVHGLLEAAAGYERACAEVIHNVAVIWYNTVLPLMKQRKWLELLPTAIKVVDAIEAAQISHIESTGVVAVCCAKAQHETGDTEAATKTLKKMYARAHATNAPPVARDCAARAQLSLGLLPHLVADLGCSAAQSVRQILQSSLESWSCTTNDRAKESDIDCTSNTNPECPSSDDKSDDQESTKDVGDQAKPDPAVEGDGNVTVENGTTSRTTINTHPAGAEGFVASMQHQLARLLEIPGVENEATVHLPGWNPSTDGVRRQDALCVVAELGRGVVARCRDIISKNSTAYSIVERCSCICCESGIQTIAIAGQHLKAELCLAELEANHVELSKQAVESRVKLIIEGSQLIVASQLAYDDVLTQALCLFVWNTSLPLLQRNLRHHLRRPFETVVNALDTIAFDNPRLHSALHVTLALIAEDSGLLSVMRANIDLAAASNENDGSHSATIKDLRRRYSVLVAVDAPQGTKMANIDPIESVFCWVERAKEAKTSVGSRTALRNAVTTLSASFESCLPVEEVRCEKDFGSGLKLRSSHLAALYAASSNEAQAVQEGRNKPDLDEMHSRLEAWAAISRTSRKAASWDILYIASKQVALLSSTVANTVKVSQSRSSSVAQSASIEANASGNTNGAASDVTDTSAGAVDDSLSDDQAWIEVKSTMRIAGEVSILRGEALIQLLKLHGMRLGADPGRLDVDTFSDPVGINEEELDSYKGLLKGLLEECMSAFEDAAEEGNKAEQSWIIANSAVCLWNYTQHISSKKRAMLLCPSFMKIQPLVLRFTNASTSVAGGPSSAIAGRMAVLHSRIVCTIGRAKLQDPQNAAEVADMCIESIIALGSTSYVQTLTLAEVRSALLRAQEKPVLSQSNGSAENPFTSGSKELDDLMEADIGVKAILLVEALEHQHIGGAKIGGANVVACLVSEAAVSALGCVYQARLLGRVALWCARSRFWTEAQSAALAIRNTLQTHGSGISEQFHDSIHLSECVAHFTMAMVHGEEAYTASSAIALSLSEYAEAALAAARSKELSLLESISGSLWKFTEHHSGISTKKQVLPQANAFVPAWTAILDGFVRIEGKKAKNPACTKLRAAGYTFVVEAEYAAGNWKRALDMADLSLRVLPRAVAPALHGHRAVCKAHIGSSTDREAPFIDEEPAEKRSQIWTAVAQASRTAGEQLRTRKLAIKQDEDDSANSKISQGMRLLNHAEWLHRNREVYPNADVQDIVQQAVELLEPIVQRCDFSNLSEEDTLSGIPSSAAEVLSLAQCMLAELSQTVDKAISHAVLAVQYILKLWRVSVELNILLKSQAKEKEAAQEPTSKEKKKKGKGNTSPEPPVVSMPATIDEWVRFDPEVLLNQLQKHKKEIKSSLIHSVVHLMAPELTAIHCIRLAQVLEEVDQHSLALPIYLLAKVVVAPNGCSSAMAVHTSVCIRIQEWYWKLGFTCPRTFCITEFAPAIEDLNSVRDGNQRLYHENPKTYISSFENFMVGLEPWRWWVDIAERILVSGEHLESIEFLLAEAEAAAQLRNDRETLLRVSVCQVRLLCFQNDCASAEKSVLTLLKDIVSRNIEKRYSGYLWSQLVLAVADVRRKAGDIHSVNWIECVVKALTGLYNCVLQSAARGTVPFRSGELIAGQVQHEIGCLNVQLQLLSGSRLVWKSIDLTSFSQSFYKFISACNVHAALQVAGTWIKSSLQLRSRCNADDQQSAAVSTVSLSDDIRAAVSSVLNSILEAKNVFKTHPVLEAHASFEVCISGLLMEIHRDYVTKRIVKLQRGREGPTIEEVVAEYVRLPDSERNPMDVAWEKLSSTAGERVIGMLSSRLEGNFITNAICITRAKILLGTALRHSAELRWCEENQGYKRDVWKMEGYSSNKENRIRDGSSGSIGTVVSARDSQQGHETKSSNEGCRDAQAQDTIPPVVDTASDELLRRSLHLLTDVCEQGLSTFDVASGSAAAEIVDALGSVSPSVSQSTAKMIALRQSHAVGVSMRKSWLASMPSGTAVFETAILRLLEITEGNNHFEAASRLRKRLERMSSVVAATAVPTLSEFENMCATLPSNVRVLTISFGSDRKDLDIAVVRAAYPTDAIAATRIRLGETAISDLLSTAEKLRSSISCENRDGKQIDRASVNGDVEVSEQAKIIEQSYTRQSRASEVMINLRDMLETCFGGALSTIHDAFFGSDTDEIEAIISADKELLSLPLELLGIFSNARIRSVTREFSLSLQFHRLERMKPAEDSGGNGKKKGAGNHECLVDPNSFHLFVDQSGLLSSEDASELLSDCREISSLFVASGGADHVVPPPSSGLRPEAARIQNTARAAGCIAHVGCGNIFSVFGKETISTMKFSNCRLGLLLDNVIAAESTSLADVKYVDQAEAQSVEVASTLSMLGVPGIICNQWGTSVSANKERLKCVVHGLSIGAARIVRVLTQPKVPAGESEILTNQGKGGKSAGKSGKKSQSQAQPVPIYEENDLVDRYNTVHYGLPHIMLKQ